MCNTSIEAGVFQWTAPDTRWLSTGWDGGYRRAESAYNVSVPTGWDGQHLAEYVDRRRRRAGFETDGPSLLTGVDLVHARGARMDAVTVYATVGLSNPATLPMGDANPNDHPDQDSTKSSDVGTVNLLVRTTTTLTDGALATLVATAVEAKTATLLALAGFTGTTSDAVIAGAPAVGDAARTDPAPWAGSATALGNATRICVRDAVRASFRSRYAEDVVPDSVVEADHGVVSSGAAEVFEP